MASPVSTTSAGDMLKTVFEGEINSNVFKDVMLLSQFEWTNRHRISGGRTIKHAVNLVRNTSSGYRSGSADSAGLPKTSPSVVKQAETTLKSLYAYMEFYGDILDYTQTDIGAFAEEFKWEIKSLTDSIKMEANRACYGDGTGELGEVASLSGTDGVVVRTSSTITPSPNLHWFEKGMHVDFYPTANFYAGTASYLNVAAGARVSLKIDTITKSATQVTLTFTKDDGSAINLTSAFTGGTIAATDKLVVEGSYMNEPYGLRAIIDNGSFVTSFLGISEATYDRWNGNIITQTYGAFAETKMQEVMDWLETYDPQAAASLVITDKNIRNKIVTTVKGTMVQPQTLEIKGGFKTIAYGAQKVFGDLYAPYSKIWGVNLSNIIPHQMNETKDNIFGAFKFDDKDGLVLHSVRDTDIFYAKGVMRYNFTCDQRNSHALYNNINPAV